MTNVHESALAWLNKQLRSKDIALFRALNKQKPCEEEIGNIENAIEIIEYLIRITENAEPKTK